jgi:hypothetical protein
MYLIWLGNGARLCRIAMVTNRLAVLTTSRLLHIIRSAHRMNHSAAAMFR